MSIGYPHIIVIAAAIFCSFAGSAQERVGGTTAQTSVDGVVYDKYLTVDDAANHLYTLNLEAYVTGNSQRYGSDIVLVLDASESMKGDRLTQMKSAATAFVNTVYNNKDSFGKLFDPHKVAIVSFNTTAADVTKKGLISLNSSTNKKTLNDAIDGIKLAEGTYPSTGLDVATNILDATDGTRPRVVVLFTDGRPRDGDDTKAIDKAYYLKNTLHTTIYTIALLDEDQIDYTKQTTDEKKLQWLRVRHFLHFVSSNYPTKQKVTDAEMTSKTGDGSEGQHDYLTMTSDAGNLTDIFNQIASASSKGGARITLDDDSIVKDVLTADFALLYPTDATEIKVSVWKVSGYSNGTYSWTVDTDYTDASKIKVSISGTNKNTIQVTGFDFTRADTYSVLGIPLSYGNWVGQRYLTNYEGRKLKIQIPITTSDSFEGGIDLPTNESSSGIYSGGKSVVTFPIPKLDYMYIGIVKTGLAKGESATFTVLRTKDKDGKPVTDDPYTIVLTGTGSAIPPYAMIKDVPDGTYTVSESTWAWSYDQKTQSLTKSFTTDGTSTWPYGIVETVKPLLFVFENTTKGLDQTTYAEAAVKNTFKGGTVTTSSHDPVQSKPKE